MRNARRFLNVILETFNYNESTEIIRIKIII